MEKTIENFAALFETRTRDNGARFVCLPGSAPEWATDIVHDAHGDMVPDDWRYKMISRVADALSDCSSEDEYPLEIADRLLSIYDSELLDWLASRSERADYCDEAAEEGFCGDDSTMMQRVTAGQLFEYLEIARIIQDAFTD